MGTFCQNKRKYVAQRARYDIFSKAQKMAVEKSAHQCEFILSLSKSCDPKNAKVACITRIVDYFLLLPIPSELIQPNNKLNN